MSRPQREGGIVLAIVLVLIFALITAVYAFQRRAIIDTTVAHNRMAAAEADALARGGIRIAEAVVYLARLKDEAASAGADAALAGAAGAADGANPASGLASGVLPGADLWERIGDFPLEFSRERSLRVVIEDEGSLLNLNALVPPPPADGEAEGGASPDAAGIGEEEPEVDAESLDDAEQYLTAVLEYIVEGIEGTRDEKLYDEVAIARNLIDWMDADSTARDGRDEDAYYQQQTPPYRARNGPFLSFDEIGLVEGVDGRLLEALRKSVTVHPVGATAGINLNRAPPWVLSLVYAGVDGDRRLVGEKTVRAIWDLRQKGKILCGDEGGDPKRCVPLAEVANGDLAEGSIFPAAPLPAKPTVFRVVAEARVDNLVRRIEAVIDTRASEGPLLLSWRRLRGTD
ncbi:MAG: general secretion pathway protein GspK [Deltaproteobacteria bacterium]|nr:general secretion pathway protein GspK [Deltaproteobacteria bacterium]